MVTFQRHHIWKHVGRWGLMAEGSSGGHKATSAREIFKYMWTLSLGNQSHILPKWKWTQDRVSEVLLLASLRPPSPGSQRQVDLARSQLLRISASCRRRIWQSEGRWLPDRIHQIHLPDAIASDAERKIGCPETEVGKDECSWEMHSDTQNNKGLFLFNSLAYTFEYSRGVLHPSNPWRGWHGHLRLPYPHSSYKWYSICQNQSWPQQRLSKSWPALTSWFQPQQTQCPKGPHGQEYCILGRTQKTLSSRSLFPRHPGELSCSYLKFKPREVTSKNTGSRWHFHDEVAPPRGHLH